MQARDVGGTLRRVAGRDGESGRSGRPRRGGPAAPGTAHRERRQRAGEPGRPRPRAQQTPTRRPDSPAEQQECAGEEREARDSVTARTPGLAFVVARDSTAASANPPGRAASGQLSDARRRSRHTRPPGDPAPFVATPPARHGLIGTISPGQDHHPGCPPVHSVTEHATNMCPQPARFRADDRRPPEPPRGRRLRPRRARRGGVAAPADARRVHRPARGQGQPLASCSRRRRAGERRPTTSCSTARPASARRRSRRSSRGSWASTSATPAARRSSGPGTWPRS